MASLSIQLYAIFHCRNAKPHCRKLVQRQIKNKNWLLVVQQCIHTLHLLARCRIPCWHNRMFVCEKPYYAKNFETKVATHAPSPPYVYSIPVEVPIGSTFVRVQFLLRSNFYEGPNFIKVQILSRSNFYFEQLPPLPIQPPPPPPSPFYVYSVQYPSE